MFRVIIYNKKTKKVEENMGPMPLRQAEKVQLGAHINLDSKNWRVSIEDESFDKEYYK